MNGNRILLDTNAVVALLKGNSNILDISGRSGWIGISVITYLEFMAFPELSDYDISLFNTFLDRIEVIGLDLSNRDLLNKTIEYRRDFKFKLPDAIIVSTALVYSAGLVTADKQIKSVPGLEVIGFNIE